MSWKISISHTWAKSHLWILIMCVLNKLETIDWRCWIVIHLGFEPTRWRKWRFFLWFHFLFLLRPKHSVLCGQPVWSVCVSNLAHVAQQTWTPWLCIHAPHSFYTEFVIFACEIRFLTCDMTSLRGSVFIAVVFCSCATHKILQNVSQGLVVLIVDQIPK